MKNKSLHQIEKEIQSIKSQLLELGDMRPGSLTKQYRHPKERTGAFFQISYTHQMKSKTEYVRPEFVKEVRQQIRNYKKFKKLIEKWIELGIQYSQLSMRSQIEQTEQLQRKRPKQKPGRQRSNG
jgi:hypothetical protein